MILFAQFNHLSEILLAVLAATVAFLLMRTRRYFNRQRLRPEPSEPAPQISKIRQHRCSEAPDELIRWEVEMHDTARQLAAQLDTKMSALQSLIAEADRAATRLETAMSRTCEPAHQEDEAQGLTPAAGEAAASPRHRDEIFTLADYGYETAEIARRIGSPIGEVELILSLRGQP